MNRQDGFGRPAAAAAPWRAAIVLAVSFAAGATAATAPRTEIQINLCAEPPAKQRADPLPARSRVRVAARPSIRPLGPVRIRAWRSADRGFIVETWRLPDAARYIEMSKKVETAEAERGRAALEATLARAGIALCPDQSSQAGNKLRALAR